MGTQYSGRGPASKAVRWSLRTRRRNARGDGVPRPGVDSHGPPRAGPPPGGMGSCRVEAGSLPPQAVQGSVSVSSLRTVPAGQVVPELVGDCCRACRAHFIELSTGPMRNVWRTDTGPKPGCAFQPAQPGGCFRSPGDGAQRRWQAELREAALPPASAASGRTPSQGHHQPREAVALPTATL
jgi:hypothetical protein